MRLQSLFRGMLVAASICAPATAHANTIQFFDTQFDTDVVTSAVGMRGVGSGNIVVSGVSGSVTRALLFWHGPTNSSDPNANANVTFAGTGVVGTNIGFSDDNFWGMANSQAYRADVTALVTGDGSYGLADFEKAGVAINGASLFVFFDDGNDANNRDVAMFNGNDANFVSAFDAAGWDLTLSGINYTGGTTTLTTYVSDGQNFGPFDDGTLRVNGNAVATGGIFQGLAPGANVGNGTLTDVRSFDITALMVLGNNNLNVTLDAGFNDALSLIVAAIDLPAGAAPPVEPIPEPATLFLFGTGAAGLLTRARRRRDRS